MPLNPTEQAAVDRMAATTPADFDGNGYELNFPNRLNDAAIGIGAAGREIATTAASAAAAKASQDAAKVSQDAAKTSETAAAGSATAAGTARTGAEGARDAAVTARTGAESARDTAQGHRTAAGNSATAAAGSATTAGDAKTAAETARDASVAARTGSETARDASVAARTGAEAARDAAQTAATQSQEGAARLVGTSTTSLTASLGDKTLTTQAGKAFGVGSRVSLANTAARVMHGAVTAYNDTSLTVSVDRVVGSGTAADWTIRLAGQTGDKGDQGSSAYADITGKPAFLSRFTTSGTFTGLSLPAGQNPERALHVGGAADPSLRIQEDGAAGFLEMSHIGVGQSMLRVSAVTGQALLDISPNAVDGVGGALVRLFRETNTTGSVQFSILQGDGSAISAHQLNGKGHSYLSSVAGQRLRVGSSTAPTTTLDVAGPVRVGQSTTAALPAASSVGAGTIAYATDGGLAVSDGAAWSPLVRKADLGSIASRNLTVSTADPSGGVDGDIWFKV